MINILKLIKVFWILVFTPENFLFFHNGKSAHFAVWDNQNILIRKKNLQLNLIHIKRKYYLKFHKFISCLALYQMAFSSFLAFKCLRNKETKRQWPMIKGLILKMVFCLLLSILVECGHKSLHLDISRLFLAYKHK